MKTSKCAFIISSQEREILVLRQRNRTNLRHKTQRGDQCGFVVEVQCRNEPSSEKRHHLSARGMIVNPSIFLQKESL